jgi:flagellar motor switch/type III secretory pathway protein FliN
MTDVTLTDAERAALQLPSPPGLPPLPPLTQSTPATVSTLTVPVTVIIGTIRAPEGFWEHLRVGDRLPMPVPTDGLKICIGGSHPLGTGDIRRVGNHLAVQIRQWQPGDLASETEAFA